MDVAKHNSTRPESGAPILAPLTKGRTLEGWWVMLSASEESRRQPTRVCSGSGSLAGETDCWLGIMLNPY